VSTATESPGDAPAARERAPRWMLALGAAGAAWFLWLMVESGLDLRVRTKVGELVALAQKDAQAAGRHPYAAQVAVDPGGAVRIRLKGEPELDGRSLALIPQAIDGKVVGWRCASDAPRQFLPRHCNQ